MIKSCDKHGKWIEEIDGPVCPCCDGRKQLLRERAVVQIYSDTIQGKKIDYLKNKGGMVTSCTVEIEMPDGKIAAVDDWGRVTWGG